MKRFHYFEISSTNDYAKEHLNDYAEIVITADFQSFGRGRNNKIWEGKMGENLYFSYGKRHSKPLKYKDAAVYQAIGALATLNTLKDLSTNTEFILKYPNDIYAKEQRKYRKISGILIEHSFIADKCVDTIIGIGININQTKFNPTIAFNAVSLKMLEIDANIEEVCQSLIENIQYFEKITPTEILQEWKKQLDIIGKEISIKAKSGKWEAIGIQDDCRLLVQNKITRETLIINNGDSIVYDLGKI